MGPSPGPGRQSSHLTEVNSPLLVTFGSDALISSFVRAALSITIPSLSIALFPELYHFYQSDSTRLSLSTVQLEEVTSQTLAYELLFSFQCQSFFLHIFMGEYQIIYRALLTCYNNNNNEGWHLLSVYYAPGNNNTLLQVLEAASLLWLPVFMWKDLHQCKAIGLLLTPSFSLDSFHWLVEKNKLDVLGSVIARTTP